MKRLISPIIAILIVTSMFSAASAASASEFTDVPYGSWYYESVDFVAQRNLFNGTGNGIFSPDSPMSRAMFVTVLGRCAGLPDEITNGIISKNSVNMRSAPTTSSDILTVLAANSKVLILEISNGWYKIRYDDRVGYVRADMMNVYSGPFSDVPAGEYYSQYVVWAFCEGIVSGTSSTGFSPSSDISREQMCLILFNFAVSQGIELPLMAPYNTFADDTQISSWAKSAVYSLQQAGVVSGREGNRFEPASGATRAEVAAILQRFIANTGYVTPDNPYGNAYAYGDDVPESASVGSGYFNDACFIGHSFVVGMSTSFGLTGADYLGVTGISAGGMLDYDGLSYNAKVKDEYGNDIEEQMTGTLDEALKANAYGKVYIMLGVNELGPESAHERSYYKNMCDLVDLVKMRQPNAVIYVMSLTPIGFERSEESEYYNKQNALLFNETLKKVCAEKRAHYLDMFTLLADEDGYLLETVSSTDGIHLLSTAYPIMKNYLFTHTMAK